MNPRPLDPADALLPLAPSQETLWEFLCFLSPSDPGRSRFNIMDVVHVGGELEIPLLTAAVSDVMRRHDSLCMVFAGTGRHPTLRYIAGSSPHVRFTDLTGLAEVERDRRVDRICEAAANREVDLRGGPLWMLDVVRLASNSHLLIPSFFHMVADGWSMQIFLRDLGTVYSARRTGRGGLAPLPLRYRDVIESRRALAAQRKARVAFLRRTLTPLSSAVPFPVADPDAAVDLAKEDECPFAFPQHVADGVSALARQTATTPFTVLMAAYAALLCLRTGWSRVVLGSTTLGRQLPGTMDLIGQFTNNVYVAAVAEPDTPMSDVIRGTHRNMLEAVRHSAPFYEIAETVNPDFSRQRPWPFLHLYNAWFQSQTPDNPPISLPGLTMHWVKSLSPATGDQQKPPAERAESHVVEVTDPQHRNGMIKRGAPCVAVRSDRRGGVIAYNPDFFAAEMVAGLAREYETTVEAVLKDPGRTVAELACELGAPHPIP